MSENPNEDICAMLIKQGEYERDVNGHVYKYIAYKKAAESLKNYGRRVKSGAEAKKLDHIGPKISQRIDDFLQNGDDAVVQSDKSDKKEDKSNQKEPETKRKKTSNDKKEGNISSNDKNHNHKDNYLIKDNYLKIYGMTKIDAMNLDLIGVVTIGELKKQKELLNQNCSQAQILCLDNFNDLIRPIPRKEIKKIFETFENVLKNLIESEKIHLELCGEYCKKLETCDFIDLLLVDLQIKSNKFSPNHIDETIEKLILNDLLMSSKDIFKIQIIAKENDKFIVMIKLEKNLPYRWMNIHFIPKDQYIPKSFYLNCSKKFYEGIQEKALDQGFILNPNYLCKIGSTCVAGSPIKLKNEEELFKYLEYTFVPPENRL